MATVPGSSSLLKLRGLPYNSSEAEISAFFGDTFQTTLIHICRRDGGRPPPKSQARPRILWLSTADESALCLACRQIHWGGLRGVHVA